MSYCFLSFLGSSSFPKPLATFQKLPLLPQLPQALLVKRGLVFLLTLALRAFQLFYQMRAGHNAISLKMVSGIGTYKLLLGGPPPSKDTEEDKNHNYLTLFNDHPDGGIC